MGPVPHEFDLAGVYLPPMLVASVFGVVAAVVTVRLLNRYRLSRHLVYPNYVLVALMVIYSLLLGRFAFGT